MFSATQAQSAAVLKKIYGNTKIADVTAQDLFASDLTKFDTVIPTQNGDYVRDIFRKIASGTANDVSVFSDSVGNLFQRENFDVDEVNCRHGGVIGDGVTHVGARLNAVITAAAGRPVRIPAGEYILDESLTGHSVINLRLDPGAVLKCSGSHNFIDDVPIIDIRGGEGAKIGETAAHFVNGIYWTGTSSCDWINIEHVRFKGGTTTGQHIGCDSTTAIKTVKIEHCYFDGFTRSGVELDGVMSADESKVLIRNCWAVNAADLTGSRRGFQVGSNQSKCLDVEVSSCKIKGLGGASINEVKGILVYSVNCLIAGNKVQNIRNAGGDDAEAIYIKTAYGKIVNNDILNGGSSHDGCITVKGKSNESDPQFSDYVIISGNTIKFDSSDYDAKAISIARSYIIVTNNILKDLRTNRETLSYSVSMGVGTSAPVSSVIVSDNISVGFVDFLGNASAPARLIDDIKVTGNIVTQLKGGYGVHTRNDALVPRAMEFIAASRSIYLTGEPVEWDRSIYTIGRTIVVSGTVSNNGTFTITGYSGQYSLTVSEPVVNEVAAGSQVVLSYAGSIEFKDNTLRFSTTGLYAFREIGSAVRRHMEFDGNITDNVARVYRIDSSVTDLVVGINSHKNTTLATWYSMPIAVTKSYTAKSTGNTGGVASAGSGNQYIEMNINGTIYKVLHDGTV